MTGKRGKSGGKRKGAGRPTVERPITHQDYARIVIPAWNLSEREEAALEWFKALEPGERLAAIVKLYFNG